LSPQNDLIVNNLGRSRVPSADVIL